MRPPRRSPPSPSGRSAATAPVHEDPTRGSRQVARRAGERSMDRSGYREEPAGDQTQLRAAGDENGGTCARPDGTRGDVIAKSHARKDMPAIAGPSTVARGPAIEVTDVDGEPARVEQHLPLARAAIGRAHGRARVDLGDGCAALARVACVPTVGGIDYRDIRHVPGRGIEVAGVSAVGRGIAIIDRRVPRGAGIGAAGLLAGPAGAEGKDRDRYTWNEGRTHTDRQSNRRAARVLARKPHFPGTRCAALGQRAHECRRYTGFAGPQVTRRLARGEAREVRRSTCRRSRRPSGRSRALVWVALRELLADRGHRHEEELGGEAPLACGRARCGGGDEGADDRGDCVATGARLRRVVIAAEPRRRAPGAAALRRTRSGRTRASSRAGAAPEVAWCRRGSRRASRRSSPTRRAAGERGSPACSGSTGRASRR